MARAHSGDDEAGSAAPTSGSTSSRRGSIRCSAPSRRRSWGRAAPRVHTMTTTARAQPIHPAGVRTSARTSTRGDEAPTIKIRRKRRQRKGVQRPWRVVVGNEPDDADAEADDAEDEHQPLPHRTGLSSLILVIQSPVSAARQGQDLGAVVGDDDACAPTARPTTRPWSGSSSRRPTPPSRTPPRREHRLDGERHARLHDRGRARLVVVQDRRPGVEATARRRGRCSRAPRRSRTASRRTRSPGRSR